ncbi:MAG: hypothetical protein KDI83_06045, partial [Gammaproteobacteria bacterium]|nr:hypothetical protein [Gammaproteobacteria bacterium]
VLAWLAAGWICQQRMRARPVIAEAHLVSACLAEMVGIKSSHGSLKNYHKEIKKTYGFYLEN